MRIKNFFLGSCIVVNAVLLLSLLNTQPVLGQTGLYAKLTQNASVVRLKEFSDETLEGQTPLILVHGIGGTDRNEWKEFLQFAAANKKFQDHFKIYLIQYDSAKSVPQLSRDLQQTMLAFIKAHQDKPFRVLAYSEGGLLYRNAMQNPVIEKQTERVIAVGTPFHGSPLANEAWLEEELKDESPFSLVRMFSKLSYFIARKKYPSFAADFQWDNFDGAIEPAEYERYQGRGELKGYSAESHPKFVTYGSYFGVEDEENQHLPARLGVTELIPKEKAGLRNLFSKHFCFSLIQDNIARMPLDNRPRQTGMQPMMGYNDGISPISSTLWLGRFTPDFGVVKDPSVRLWNALKSLQGKGVARLFPGLDHRNWLEGKTRAETAAVADLLNPQEKPKSVFDWFIYDLMS